MTGNLITLMNRPSHPAILPGRAVLLSLLLCAGSGAAGPERSFQAGNRLYAEQRFEDAVTAYMTAAEADPESAEIHYNLGIAQYRAGMPEEAMQSFGYAASVAETAALQSRCWYNLGNCLAKTGEALREADPEAAVSCYHQALWVYRLALEGDAEFADAAYNLEIMQRLAAGLEEEIRQQQEQEQRQNELMAYLRGMLQAFADRQTALLGARNTGEAQKQLAGETRDLAKVMEASGLQADIPLPDGSRTEGPLKESWRHTLAAADAMVRPDQQTALAELLAALNALPADPNREDSESDEDSETQDDDDMDYEQSDEDADLYQEADPFGDFSEYEEIRGLPPPNQTEVDILAEEVRNQERRKKKTAGDYQAVEKDW